MISPHWEPMSNPLDELREISRTAPTPREGYGYGYARNIADWEAWEDELDSPTLRAALEYWEGE